MSLISWRAASVAFVCMGASVASGQMQGAEFLSSQISFSEEHAARGMAPYTHTQGECLGVSAADYDGDGDIDVFVPTGWGTPSRLYRNDGTGNFTDVAVASGLNSTSNDRMGVFFDYDGDRDLDLVIGNDHHGQLIGQPSISWPDTLRLFRQNADHTFTEVTAAAGLDGPWIGAVGESNPFAMIGTITAGDLDADGDVDLYLGLWLEDQYVFRNNGDGTFTDMTATSGDLTRVFANWQAVMHDFNNDGLLDIYCAVDGEDGIKALLINQGNFVFDNQAAAYGLLPSFNDMGVAFGDPDNDGDLDIYVTEIHDSTGTYPYWTDTQNVLFRDNGPGANPRYEDIAIEAGVAFCDWGWGCDWGDFDNDRDQDLAVTNGHGSAHFSTDRSRLFENVSTDPLVFTEIGAAAGFADTEVASGLAAADFDRDGLLDLVEVHHPGGMLLYMNDSTLPAGEDNWVVIKPRRYDARGDHYSIGTVVRVWAGGEVMTRLISAGWTILGQVPYEAHFGLGDATTIDRIEVSWPDGRRRVITNKPWANQIVEVVPGPRGAGLAAPE